MRTPFGIPASAKETSRAPKLCPTRCTRTFGASSASRPSAGPSPALPTFPARRFIAKYVAWRSSSCAPFHALASPPGSRKVSAASGPAAVSRAAANSRHIARVSSWSIAGVLCGPPSSEVSEPDTEGPTPTNCRTRPPNSSKADAASDCSSRRRASRSTTGPLRGKASASPCRVPLSSVVRGTVAAVVEAAADRSKSGISSSVNRMDGHSTPT